MSWEPMEDSLIAEHQEAIADRLAAIYRHLGGEAPDPEAPLQAILRHPSGSVLYAIDQAFYAFRDGAAVRYRPAGEGMMEMMARRDGRLVGSAVVPESSVFPEGSPSLE